MLVLQGAAAGRRAVVMGLVVELAGQRLRGPAVRGDAYYCWESPAEVFGGAGCASRAHSRTRGGVRLGVGER